MPTPIQKTSVSQQVVDYVLGCIDRGELKQGDCLPGEREFAESLGISRVPLREGISALAAMGIVEKRHGEGNFIAEFSSDVLGRILHTYTMLDHTLANLQTLLFLTAQGATGHLIGQQYLVSSVHNGVLRFPETATGILSVFCLDGKAEGVTIRGLQYGLEQGSLESGYPLGVSNHFVGQPAMVRVEKGTLVVMYDVSNGFCTGEPL